MLLTINRKSILSKTPIALLAFQAILSCSFSTSTVLGQIGSSGGIGNSLSRSTINKMSNGEGYVDEISPKASQLIEDSIQLFSANPSLQIFKRSWTPDSIFEDPLCFAKGERQYKAQWWGLAAAFSKCELQSWHVTKDTPEQVNYVQRQKYTFKGLGISKEMISTISMKLNKEGKIVHMQDRWNHQDPPANLIAWPLRRLNAIIVPYFVSVPTEDPPKQQQQSHTDL